MKIIEVNEVDFTTENGSYRNEYLGNIVKVRSTDDFLYFTRTGDQYCYLKKELVEIIQEFLKKFSGEQNEVETRKEPDLSEIEQIEEIEELQKQKYSGEIRKAINFDERIKIMEKDEPLFIFINFLHAQQIQIGRKNIINNNFVKEPEKGESILSKLKNFFKSYIFDFRFDSKFFKMVKNLFS